ncbi:MAG: hypothetical protein WA755_10225 [Candidatus Acidiferrales bacterium]
MKRIRNIVIGVAASLLFVPLAYGQDLSKYRNFSLGTSLTAVSKQVNEDPATATVIHQSPALIQELTWWPVQSYQATAPSEPIQEVLFSFYNGELYKIVVTYESSATEGMTSADMMRAISAKYGTATAPVAEIQPATLENYGNAGAAIACWQDAQYSLTLSRSALSNTYQLVMFSKQMNGEADAAIAESAKQERDDAPQREIARVKKAADELAIERQANVKAFQP